LPHFISSIEAIGTVLVEIVDTISAIVGEIIATILAVIDRALTAIGNRVLAFTSIV
jgi:hypothetical protein